MPEVVIDRDCLQKLYTHLWESEYDPDDPVDWKPILKYVEEILEKSYAEEDKMDLEETHNWINVRDRLPEKGRDDVSHLLLWDSVDKNIDKEVGEFHIGFFADGRFGTYEAAVDDGMLNVTHWSNIRLPEED